MYEKILQKLKAQRGATSNVSDRTLEDYAKSIGNLITTDEQLAGQDFTQILISMDGNISHYTAEAIKKQQKAQEEANKKAEEEKQREAAKKAKQAKQQDGEDTPDWVKAIMEQNNALAEQTKKLSEDLLVLKSDKITSSRSARLNKVLEGLPDYYVSTVQSAFKIANFQDEDAFTEYLKTVETSKTAFIQAAKENGLNVGIPGTTAKKSEDDGQTAELRDAIKLVTKQKEKKDDTNK